MTDPSTTTEEPTTEVTGRPTDRDVAADPATLVEAELLVEEISIDGMCGVY
jgi:mycofactocin precursor